MAGFRLPALAAAVAGQLKLAAAPGLSWSGLSVIDATVLW